VLLNLPGNAMKGLDPASVIFAESTPQASTLLKRVATIGMAKAYAWYDDAWWATKLGMMEGNFDSQSGSVPLLGRYHDGPLRCLVGYDTAGEPVYSGNKVAFGNCSGALEVFYSPCRAGSYWSAMMTSPLAPLTVVTDGDSAESDAVLGNVHAALMAWHADAIKAKGYDPTAFSPPKTVVVGNWISAGNFTPGIGALLSPGDEGRKAVRKPSPSYNVYVANQDYGYETGWAVGSLIMAEKVLQAELGLPRPAWLNATWYEANVLGHA